MRPTGHLESSDRYLIYNNPLNWGDAGINHAPADVDVVAYQKRINQICGVSASGHPIVRLKWAWDAREWSNCEWDAFGIATKGEWRQTYRFLTVKVGEEYVDISVPRWVLEERFEPGQYEDSWDASRYVYDDDLGCAKDVMGEMPRDGIYKMIWSVGMICTHDANRKCCERAQELERSFCWGYYKTPGDKELEMLGRAVQERDSGDLRASPHDPLPDYIVKRLQAAEVDRVELKARRNREYLLGKFQSLNAPSMLGQTLFDVGPSFQRKEKSGLHIVTD